MSAGKWNVASPAWLHQLLRDDGSVAYSVFNRQLSGWELTNDSGMVIASGALSAMKWMAEERLAAQSERMARLES